MIYRTSGHPKRAGEPDSLLRIEVKAGVNTLLNLRDMQSFMKSLQTALNEVAEDLSQSSNHGISYEIADAYVGSFGLALRAVGSEFAKADPAECLEVFSVDIQEVARQSYRSGLSVNLLKTYTNLIRTLSSINATVNMQYRDNSILIDKRLRENLKNVWKERIADNVSVVGGLDAVIAHGGQYNFHLYPKLEHEGRIECVFKSDMLPVVAELLKRRQLVQATGRGHFGPVGLYPFKIELNSPPKAMIPDGGRLRSYVGGLRLVPSGMSAADYLQRNREAMGFAE